MKKSLLSWLCAALSVAVAAGAAPPEVSTTAGVVAGSLDEAGSVAIFRGIPYAAPPTGALRWRAPQAAASWPGVRQAKEAGPVCPQTPRPGVGEQSEDCLTLNVWTPSGQLTSPTEALPVMVWIHGGAFRGGSGSNPATDARLFAREGVVVVSINYRLGALGFLAHPALLAEAEAAGEPGVNYGLLDMVAALRWVRDNVGAFGGDPGRVTLFGMSAGGMAIQLLMVTPGAQGLFHGAISMSGYGTWPLPRLGEPAFGHPPAEDLGIGIIARGGGLSESAARAATAAELRELTPQQLLAGIESLHLPLVDAATLPDEPGVVFAHGRQHAVPFVAGGTSFDGAILAMAGLPHEGVLASLGDDLDAFRELYAGDFAVSDRQGASRLFGDLRYTVASRTLARSMKTVSSPAYLYFFHHVPLAKRGEWIGTPHGGEVAPLFGVAQQMLDEETSAVGAKMRSAFVHFAKTGAPGGEGLPDWPAHTAENDAWMVFGQAPVLRRGVLRGRLDLIERRYRERVSGSQLEGSSNGR
ncbi:MAG: carboxylesterase family protein [Acidobacteriota bacterium]